MSKLQRTVIRAEVIGTQTVMFEIADWKPSVWIEINKWSVPPDAREKLHPGFRCWVSANLNATKSEDLKICEWSLFP